MTEGHRTYIDCGYSEVGSIIVVDQYGNERRVDDESEREEDP